MARKARLRSESGVYHVAARSAKTMFLDEADRLKFSEILLSVKQKDLLEVYAYAYLDTGAHLIVKEGLNDFSNSMRETLSKYAVYYNNKYKTLGSLYDDRFKSQPIDEQNLLDCVRFVHKQSTFNSFNAYIKKGNIVDTDSVLFLVGGLFDFKLYMEKETDTDAQFLSLNKPIKLTDEELVFKIKGLFTNVNSKELANLNEEQFKILLSRIRAIEGASIRQIARVLDVPKSVVERSKTANK